jgi:hypothetical protein
MVMSRPACSCGINLYAALSVGMLAAVPALGNTGIVRHPDGTAGTITTIDDRTGVYFDSHGDTRPLILPGGMMSDPHGGTPPSAVAPSFGTPSPPSHLTPAPILPFHPNRPLMPPPAVVPPPATGSFGSGGVPR